MPANHFPLSLQIACLVCGAGLPAAADARSLASTFESPVAALAPPERNAMLWPSGYYDGDPLPASTVYLTFDDGPGDFTGEILAILRDEGVRATFFINSFDREGPLPATAAANGLLPWGAVLRRMVAEGHAVGNHTFSHQGFTSAKNGCLAFQLDTLQAHFNQAFGPGAPRIWLLRPPFGSPWLGGWDSAAERRRVTSELANRGVVCLWTTGWDSADSVDWVKGEWWQRANPRYRPGSPAYLAKVERLNTRVLRHADGRASGVILMHDIHPSTRDGLRAIIRELKARGYRFGTMEDYALWRWGGARVAAWRGGGPVATSSKWNLFP